MDACARDVMSKNLLVATSSMTVEECLKVLVNSKVTGLPVVDSNGRLVGVVSEYDVLSQISEAWKKGEGPGKSVLRQGIKFTPQVEAITDDVPLESIVPRFIQSKVRRLPVLDKDERLVGIITRRDMIRVLYYRMVVE